MAQTDCIGSIKVAMKIRRDMIGVASEALNSMFQFGEEELVEQVHVCNIWRPSVCIGCLSINDSDTKMLLYSLF